MPIASVAEIVQHVRRGSTFQQTRRTNESYFNANTSGNESSEPPRESFRQPQDIFVEPPPSSVLCFATKGRCRDWRLSMSLLLAPPELILLLGRSESKLTFSTRFILEQVFPHHASQEQKEGRGRGSRCHARCSVRSRQE
jgi:hypothetical protein